MAVPPLRDLPGRRSRLRPRGITLATVGLLAGALAPLTAGVPMASPALAAASAVGCPAPAGTVSCSPKTLTPSFPAKTTKTFQIRQLVQCGSLMYGVGTFSQIIGRTSTGKEITYSRNNVFSFHATRPYAVTSWNPNVNGEVNSIAVGGTNCSTAYLGGSFSSVHGKTEHNIAAVSTSTGAVVTKFRGDANNTVQTLALHAGRLLTGGYFTAINGQNRKFLVGLSPSTGAPDSYLSLDISGNYQYKGVDQNGTRVYNEQISHNGKRMLVEGDFTSVGGKSRQQIFMLSLGASKATVTGWTSTEFTQHCVINQPFYVRAAAWGPTDAAVYIATTGYHPTGGAIGKTRRTGLCDAAVKFPATNTAVKATWINYTGCDSLYSVVAGTGTVYVAGHERFANNPLDCDDPAGGPGSVKAPGIGGLAEVGGKIDFDPTRSRGLGADDLLLTKAGLWIASDNLSGTTAGKPFTSDACGGVSGRAGICFLAS
jgi:hypothetical protein